MKEPQIEDALKLWKRIVNGWDLDDMGITPKQESVPIMNLLEMMIEKYRRANESA